MTIKDLEQYRQLQNEVKRITQRLEILQSKPQNIVSDSVRGSSHDITARECIFTITGLDQRSKIKYDKLKEVLRERATRLQDKLIIIEEFISTVPRSDIRRIIDYRYIQGFSWATTSRRVYGYPNEARARMAVTRYFAEI
ncbi:MAG: hypothetical protein FWB91_02060 [Defluviitaleaceae bacterium]|nr:hypothetical protein [Defluviitaleaceae bacterium]